MSWLFVALMSRVCAAFVLLSEQLARIGHEAIIGMRNCLIRPRELLAVRTESVERTAMKRARMLCHRPDDILQRSDVSDANEAHSRPSVRASSRHSSRSLRT